MPPVSATNSHISQAMSRRGALQTLAAGAFSLASGCSRPDEAVVADDALEELPYVRMPEGLVPGVAQRYATAFPLAGYARGALVTSFEGRPIKVEGNPRHPASLGATDAFAQAEILSLYDPDRSQAIRVAREISDWPAFDNALRGRMAEHAADGGASLRLLSGQITSPTLLDQIQRLQAVFPNMRWHVFEPAITEDIQASQAIYGKRLTLLPRLGEADAIAAFDADPLGPGPDQVRFARALVERRKRDRESVRLYSAESTMTLTGAFADHRLAAHPDAIEAMMVALAASLGAPVERPELPHDLARFIDAVAKDLGSRPGRGLVLAGPSLANARALCAWVNDRLGAPVDAFDLDPQQASAGALAELSEDIGSGRVETLVILDSNPVATAPGDLGFEALFARVPFRVHLGLYFDETAEACTWHLPMPHPLESWSDVAARDGVVSIVQPLIRPLHDSYSAHELLAALARQSRQGDYDRIRATWRARWGELNFEERWRRTLVDGVVSDTAKTPIAKPPAKFPGLTPGSRAPQDSIAAIFCVDPSVFDGRFANNAWLQECPQPFSKAVWGNAVEIALEDAKRLGIAEGDGVEVRVGARAVFGPARLSNGLAAGVLKLSLGYGRTRSGAIGDEVGFNAAVLQTSSSPWIARNVTLRRVGRKGRPPPSTAGLFALDGRAKDLAPEIEVGARASTSPPRPSFNRPWPTPAGDPYAWGMVIDTGACVGCNACVVACQSENNVPVVGPDEVGWGRDMHWLRIDVYDHGTAHSPRPLFQPVPCMHCEAAPCEPVCPVEASVHDHEGLNVQVYNRCVGTRFCQSNCPYKVRRFNFFGYADGQEYSDLGDPLIKAANNPDVSVRARGVMEKCTYCVQRISRVRCLAEYETRLIAEGEVVTACQAACPTQAIHFGNLADAHSRVSELRRASNHYALLDELHTRPRTTYLARLRNSNAEIGAGA
jgi:Fe-S-cluster-containing dehydrogenase component